MAKKRKNQRKENKIRYQSIVTYNSHIPKPKKEKYQKKKGDGFENGPAKRK